MDPNPILERLERHLSSEPTIASDVFVAHNSTIIGNVSIASKSSIWFQSVLRADINEIRIGSQTNIQDGSVLHVADQFGLRIGDQVTCGHRAILHACAIGDRVLIGMGATIMDGAEIGPGTIIGAGALVTKGALIPPGSLLLGAPARIVRKIEPAEEQGIARLAEKYAIVARRYLERAATNAV